MLKFGWTPKQSQLFRKFGSGFMVQLLVCHVFLSFWQTKLLAAFICITAWVGLLGWGELLSNSISWLTDHTWIGHFFSQVPYLNGRENYFHLLCKGSWKLVGETQYSTARELQFSFSHLLKEVCDTKYSLLEAKKEYGILVFLWMKEWMVQKYMTGFFVLQNNRAEKLRTLGDGLLYSICNFFVWIPMY